MTTYNDKVRTHLNKWSQKPKRRALIGGGVATAAVTTHRQVLPDGEVLGLDVTQVQPVGEVMLKVPHQVQEAQRNVIGCLPGAPPSGPAPGWHHHLLQGEDILVPGAAGRQVLHGVEVSAGAQDLGHVAAQVLQDPAGDSRGSR